MENLPPEVEALLRPVEFLPNGTEAPSFPAHRFREERLERIPDYPKIQQRVTSRRLGRNALGQLPYMTEQGIRNTFKFTQEAGENHRRLTPRLQEMLYYDDTRAMLMQGIEEVSQRNTERLLRKAKRTGEPLQCDVAILGGGPHGVAAAMMVREMFPNLCIFIVDENGLGGQWGSYGPNPSYLMNSRVREANNNFPPIPRTRGNINPLGRNATLELSDIVTGHYALNTDMANVTKINGYLSVDAALVNIKCQAIVDAGNSATMIVESRNGDTYDIDAGVVIDACGIDQSSTLKSDSQALTSPSYFNTRSIYRHYGNYERKPYHQPLELFHRKHLIVVGGGDAALTGLEGLLGRLTPSYGVYGTGRYIPNKITWVGAPGLSAKQIDGCLRSRYKDGIVQNLPKDSADQGAIICPILPRAKAFRLTAVGVELVLANGDVISGDILFDCTNQTRQSYGPRIIDTRRDQNMQSAVFGVGPGAKPSLPQQTREIIRKLGIPENTAALWALMELTERAAQCAGKLAVLNAMRRDGDAPR